MLRRVGPFGLLLVAAPAFAVLVGSIVGQPVVPPAETGMLASGVGPATRPDLAEDELPSTFGVAEDFAPEPTGAPQPTVTPAILPAITARPTATSPTILTRVPKPAISGPLRVGIQAGHWQTDKAPPELRALLTQTGTSWRGINEVTINLDIAERIKDLLAPKGIVVDILPTTVTPGYVADAVVALHGDGDGTGANSGYKMAFSTRRTPYEAALLQSIKTHYGAATGLPYDATRISRNMTNYYLFGWWRNKYSTAPHTPSVILEMGYVSNDHDRELMMDRPDVVAGGIAEGIIRFLAEHPRDKLFGQDLLVQLPAPRGTPTPRP